LRKVRISQTLVSKGGLKNRTKASSHSVQAILYSMHTLVQALTILKHSQAHTNKQKTNSVSIFTNLEQIHAAPFLPGAHFHKTRRRA